MIDFRPSIASIDSRTACYARALRPTAPIRCAKNENPERRLPSRERRGVLGWMPSAWRRGAMGPNRISCLGVWKTGTRREAVRINRMGDTDWRRPYRDCPQAPFRIAADFP